LRELFKIIEVRIPCQHEIYGASLDLRPGVNSQRLPTGRRDRGLAFQAGQMPIQR
jgi:hypothetical protein